MDLGDVVCKQCFVCREDELLQFWSLKFVPVAMSESRRDGKGSAGFFLHITLIFKPLLKGLKL